MHTKPVPQETALSAPYWKAAREGKLMLQSCGSCGKVRHYPQLLCGNCQSNEVAWVNASGAGTVHSWTVTHHAFHPGFASEVPYTLVTVDLPEGVRMLGRYDDATPLKLGLPVQLKFEPDAQGTPVPRFTYDSSNKGQRSS